MGFHFQPTTNLGIIDWQLDEIDGHIKRREASFGVDFRYVFGDSLLGCIIPACADWMVYEPEGRSGRTRVEFRDSEYFAT